MTKAIEYTVEQLAALGVAHGIAIPDEAERLAIAARAAPFLRRTTQATKARLVNVTSKAGEVLREVPFVDAIRGLAFAYGIEHTPDQTEKPKTGMCCACGLEYALTKLCQSREYCGCLSAQKTCVTDGCDRVPGKYAFGLGSIKSRTYSPWMCASCAVKNKRSASMTPEQRSEIARKANASMTPEQRRENARKMCAASVARTPEQRSEIARKASTARTPEQRSEIARKRHASLTPEQRSENARKAQAARWSKGKP